VTGPLIILTTNQERWPCYSAIEIIYVIIAFALFYFITKLKPARRILVRPERDPHFHSFLTHGWLAVSTEVFSIYINPALSFSFSRQRKNR